MINACNSFGCVTLESYVCRVLAYQVMPTLLKVKPASLLMIDKSVLCNLDGFYDILEEYLERYSSRYLLLQETERRLYLIVYNENLLNQTITCGLRQSFLEHYGYPLFKDRADSSLLLLGKRYRNFWATGEFPHEIGIFLGYPLRDVEEFIRNQGRNYLLCGLWKVYGQVKVAETAFFYYHQLRAKAVRLAETSCELMHLNKKEEEQYHQLLWELLSY
jgi:hypothetical protein